MPTFFPHLGQTQTNAPADFLSARQAGLRESKASALIEIEIDATRQMVLLFAHGEQVGAFVVDNAQARPVVIHELPPAWVAAKKSYRLAILPDVAARLAWLACESQQRNALTLSGPEAWTRQLNLWRDARFAGLAQVSSASEQAFAYFQNGRPVKQDTIFSNADGFSSSLPEQWHEKDIQVVTYEINPASVANQCLQLRQSTRRWSNAVLKSYRNIAGQKLLQVMNHDVMLHIRPRQWNIQVEEEGILDEHFFPAVAQQAQAYQTVLLACNQQMSFAIGDYLTRRILIEMFDELSRDERSTLENHRLIPASISA